MTSERRSEHHASSDDEPPLDPALESLRWRLMRLMRGGMILGLGAVVLVAALIWRFGGAAGDDRPDAAPAPIAVPGALMGGTVDVALPRGARVVGTAVGSDRLALTLQTANGRTVIHVVDTTGRLVVRYRLTPEE